MPSLRDQTAKDNQKGAPLYLLAIAFLLFVFGVVAEAVVEGKSSAFDRSIILAFRDHGNPSALIGPAWVQEAARDLSAITYLTIGALLARSQSSPRIGVYFIVLAALKAGGDSETRRGRGLGRYWSELQRQPLNDLQT